MLYFLYGEDTKKSKEKFTSLLNLLFRKKPNASFFKLDTDNFSPIKLEELAVGQGLFENKYIVHLDNLFEDKDISPFLIKKLEDLKKSENVFICVEKKVPQSVLKEINKQADQVQKFPVSKNKERVFATKTGDFKINNFNIFDLATCFGNRDKKNLWVLYQKTKARNIPTEEVSGILFWQLKIMFQVFNSKDIQETNLKPFVFNQAKKFLKKYSLNEMKKMSADLVSIYHKAHRGLCEFDLALEKFILEL